MLVSIWEQAEGDGLPRIVVGAAYADAAGRARIVLPRRAFGALSVEVVGATGAARHVIKRDRNGLPGEAVIIKADVASDGPDAHDCACDSESPPRAPDHAELVGVDGVYASDLGGSCVKLTTPNRTLEEYNFTTLVRTTDPVLWGVAPRKRSPLSAEALNLVAKIAFGAGSIDAALKEKGIASTEKRSRSRRLDIARTALGGSDDERDDIRLSSEAYRNSGLLAARAWRDTVDLGQAHKAIVESAATLSEDVLRHALSDPDGFTPTAL